MKSDGSVTYLDFLRHGEPVGGRKYRGQIDDPLSDKGWAEMQAAVGASRPWQHIISSPLSRCRAFAEALATEAQLPLTFDDRFKEVAFGEWEGQTSSQIEANDKSRLFRFKCDPVSERPQGAEDLTVFHARVAQAFNAVVQQFRGQHVLVVAHAGVIRMAMCHVLGISPLNAYRIQVGSAAVARFCVEQRSEGELAQLYWLTPAPGKGL